MSMTTTTTIVSRDGGTSTYALVGACPSTGCGGMVRAEYSISDEAAVDASFADAIVGFAGRELLDAFAAEYLRKKCSAKTGMSSLRWRSGGITIGMTLNR